VRILLLTDWMTNSGGAETYIVSLRDALRAAGDEVQLLTCGAGLSGATEADERAYSTDRSALQAVLQIANPFAVTRLRAVLRTFRPDVVLLSHFAYHLSAAILPQLRAHPTVVVVMDYKVICPLGTKLLPNTALCTVQAGAVCWRNGCVSLPHWLRDRPRYALLRSGLRHVDRVLCISRWMQDELAMSGVTAEHVPPPVAPPGAEFRRAPAAVPSFVYCGRLSKEKGVALLLRAFAGLRKEMPNACLRIVGDGPQRGVLEGLATSLGLGQAVNFVGVVAPRDVAGQLVDAWALVAPSLWAEPFGLIAVEAIVRNVPVVASASGGFGETVLPGQSGLLFANGNEAELLACLRQVADRRVFPSHTLAPDVVQRAIDSSSPRRHTDRIRSIFHEVVTSSAI
jgi:glycosyltransferase involved in cell wall biosynthesis